MDVLITGRGTSGSWEIRGRQLGAALGARVEPMAETVNEPVAVVVKRAPDRLLRSLRGRLLVWDVVDAFPQPSSDSWTQDQCLRWLDHEVERIRPNAIIAATERMAVDCRRYGVPVLCLPHHHRPDIARNPIRERIEVVGYEGSPRYIVGWSRVIERECSRIGARFVVNPSALADVDVVLALRDSKGYAPRQWKSNVKLANAHGSGTPWIGCREAGYLETASGAEYWADTPAELAIALDWLADRCAREYVADRLVQKAFPLEAAAERLKTLLRSL